MFAENYIIVYAYQVSKTERQMADEIFLSYSRSDKKRAKIFADALEKQGYSVWWDPEMLGGGRIDSVIQEKLDSAKCVLVLWSKESVKSSWVYDEATRGKNKDILIPILIDNVNIPLGFGLINALNLIDWKGDQTDPNFLKLLESVSKKLEPHYSSREKNKQNDIEGGISIDLVGPEFKTENKDGPRKEERKIKFLFFILILIVGSIIVFDYLKQPDIIIRPEDPPKGKTEWTNQIEMEFKLIKAGEFDMGSTQGLSDEMRVRHINISYDFYISKNETTQKQWYEVMGGWNPSYFKFLFFYYDENLPVTGVSWNEVRDFIKKYNDGPGAQKYRLPTEAEWEYAARAGTTTEYSFDDESKLGDYAWYLENSGDKIHPIGTKYPNPWGLYDMYGNVYEWVQDKYYLDYNGAPTNGSSREGENPNRVIRGGGYDSFNIHCRSASRGNKPPDEKYYKLGFRLVRDVDNFT